ncbi:ABC transporter ATP-binding protein [Candidatus Acetothermia bacterium]|nr:ABC transporter ATP-binding protein [Candidatus Acetothermia bacterium]MBI3643400.1 ABC transporter ATP-binding protein [Candidatus Acetothermia bacterium]
MSKAGVINGAILQFDGVSKSFGGLQAINHLSFDVREGEILGLIGPNGAGKTTIFNLITGVYHPDQGKIRFQNTEITGWQPHRVVNAGIARTFQIPRPFHHKTITKNVEIALIPNAILSHGLSKQERSDTVSQLCAKVSVCKIFGTEGCHLIEDGFCDCMFEFPSALPHAALRNLEIAKAMATKPNLLLLDEPFAGLTMSEVDDMSALLRTMKQEGRTQIVVDHNMRGLMRLVDRVVVINFGQKLAEGTPEEIAKNPAVQEAYLSGSSN